MSDHDVDSFLDDEAEVESGDSRSDSGSGDEQLHLPGFQKLPAELRAMIWGAFCPDLVATGPRVLQVYVGAKVVSGGMMLHLHPTLMLEENYKPLGRMLEVSRETRAMALKAFPNALPIGTGNLKFKPSTDIIYFSDNTSFPGYFPAARSPLSFKDIKNVAIDIDEDEVPDIGRIVQHFEGLTNLYYALDALNESKRHLRWCSLGSTARYYTEYEELWDWREPAKITQLFCWPSAEHRDRHWDSMSNPQFELNRIFRFDGIAFDPMVIFDLHQGMKLYNRVKALAEVPVDDPEWDSSSEDEDEPDGYGEISESDSENEYDFESGFIDDDQFIDDLSSEEEAAATDEDEAVDEAITDAPAMDGTTEAAFSSLEPEERPRLSHRKRRIDDSEDSDEDCEEPAAKKPYGYRASGPSTSRQKRRIIDSDDESDAEEPKAKKMRTSRVVLDSEEDAGPSRGAIPSSGTLEDSDEEPVGATRRRNRVVADDDGSDVSEGEPAQGAGSEAQGTESEQGQSSDSDVEDDSSIQSLSLAERLNRLPEPATMPLESDDSDADDDDGDSFITGGRYAEEDDDEEDDSEDEGGMFDGAAEESENDDGDASDDGW